MQSFWKIDNCVLLSNGSASSSDFLFFSGSAHPRIFDSAHFSDSGMGTQVDTGFLKNDPSSDSEEDTENSDPADSLPVSPMPSSDDEDQNTYLLSHNNHFTEFSF